jgi:hypothetical protein
VVGFVGRGNPFGAAPTDEDGVSGRVRGF